MRKQWALIFFVAILFGIGAPPASAAQKRERAAQTAGKVRTPRLGSVEQFKDAFQGDAGKVRLVALVSPT